MKIIRRKHSGATREVWKDHVLARLTEPRCWICATASKRPSWRRCRDTLVELLSAQIARLRLLEWELEEASRKDNWSVRYEPKGPESDVWRRAAYRFCGV